MSQSYAAACAAQAPLEPGKRVGDASDDRPLLGLRAMLGGLIACYLTATLVGMLI